MNEQQRQDFLERLRSGQAIGNVLVDLKISRYTYRKERQENPEFNEQIQLCYRYPEGVCDLLVFTTALSGGPDSLRAALAFNAMRHGRRYRNQLLKLREAAVQGLQEIGTSQSTLNLERLDKAELAEFCEIYEKFVKREQVTDKDKIMYWDLMLKATQPPQDTTNKRMLSSVVMAGEHENGEDA
jgi:hypothetical protein